MRIETVIQPIRKPCDTSTTGLQTRSSDVVHVVLSLDCGGLERVVLALVAQGIERGQRVGVVCLERAGTLANQVEAHGGWVACVDKKPGIQLKTIGALRRVFSESRAEIIHTHQIAALFYTGLANFQSGGARVVHTEHGKHYESRAQTRQLGRCAAWFADRFFCVSKDIAESVLSHRIAPANKVAVVPNGIDTASLSKRDDAAISALRNSLGIPPSARVVGTIGRLNEVKCQDLLLRAFNHMRARVPDAHLVIVGDGPLMHALQSQAIELGLQGACHLVGYQTEPEKYLHLMDVFALTSRSEGMPLVILEAWAAGVPVVASRVGGLPELISDGNNGLLFSPGDDLALSAALESLLSQPECLRRMGEEGRHVVQSQFDVSRMADRYASRYQELLGFGRAVRTL
jgi:glycosyltransferase involved in cell wall biosynthesis